MRWDQWLWNIRLYRSRSLAQTAIKEGRVLVGGVAIKPARDAKAGETVSAKTEDLTPPEAREEARQKTLEPGFRARGLGRPTKRERRQIDRWADPL